MIIKDKAKDYVLDGSHPSQMMVFTFHEKCVLYEENIHEGRLVLRKVENKRILCTLCLVEIAEVQ